METFFSFHSKPSISNGYVLCKGKLSSVLGSPVKGSWREATEGFGSPVKGRHFLSRPDMHAPVGRGLGPAACHEKDLPDGFTSACHVRHMCFFYEPSVHSAGHKAPPYGAYGVPGLLKSRTTEEISIAAGLR